MELSNLYDRRASTKIYEQNFSVFHLKTIGSCDAAKALKIGVTERYRPGKSLIDHLLPGTSPPLLALNAGLTNSIKYYGRSPADQARAALCGDTELWQFAYVFTKSPSELYQCQCFCLWLLYHLNMYIMASLISLLNDLEHL
jgi:hypothetical protein